MMHTSRTKAAEYIAAGRVEVNHLPLRAAHEAMYEADIITVRGVGRFRLAEIGGPGLGPGHCAGVQFAAARPRT